MIRSLKALHRSTASNTAYISALWSFECWSWIQRCRSLEKKVATSSFPSPHKDSKDSLVEFWPSRIWRVEFLQARSKYQNVMIRNFITWSSGAVMIHVMHLTWSDDTEELKKCASVPAFSLRRTISFAPGVWHCSVAVEATTKIVIHWTLYLFSDWPRAYSEFSKSASVSHLAADYTTIMSRTLKVTGNHVMYDRGAWFLRVILSTSRTLCCLPSVKKEKHYF